MRAWINSYLYFFSFCEIFHLKFNYFLFAVQVTKKVKRLKNKRIAGEIAKHKLNIHRPHL